MPPELIPPPLLTVTLGVGFGLLQAFFGYRIFKLTLGLVGFFVVGLVVMSAVQPHTTEPWIPWVAGLVGGLLGAAILPTLYFLGIFLAGAFLGAIVGFSFAAVVTPVVANVIALVLGLIAGILALKAQKLMIILATAFGGIWLALASAASWPTGEIRPDPFQERWLIPGFVLWIILGIAGCFAQWQRDEKPRREK
jgi:hypothetical protein